MALSDTINSVIDTAQDIADNPMLRLIGLVFPQANSIIDIIERYKGTIDAAQPIIAAAVSIGEPVFDKVIEAIPKFGAVVAHVVSLMPAQLRPEAAIENVTRLLGGFHEMTFEEEQAWMNRMTPGNDPSQENSKYTVG
jgi:hypothetical protein